MALSPQEARDEGIALKEKRYLEELNHSIEFIDYYLACKCYRVRIESIVNYYSNHWRVLLNELINIYTKKGWIVSEERSIFGGAYLYFQDPGS